jgi:hypothetical protein
MKIFMKVALVTLSAATLTACNENNAADRRDYNASARMIRDDNASIRASEEQLEADRAEKAAADANDDTSHRVSSSMKIGADHVAVGAKKAKRKVDETVHAKHEEDLEQ